MGIGDERCGFNSTIKTYDQCAVFRRGMIYSCLAHSVAFPVPVRYIEVYLPGLCQIPQEIIQACYGSGSIHVVVSKDEDSFTRVYCPGEPVNSFFHILHEPGTVQLIELGPEESPGLLERFDTPLGENTANGLIDTKCMPQ